MALFLYERGAKCNPYPLRGGVELVLKKAGVFADRDDKEDIERKGDRCWHFGGSISFLTFSKRFFSGGIPRWFKWGGLLGQGGCCTLFACFA